MILLWTVFDLAAFAVDYLMSRTVIHNMFAMDCSV